jgi:AbrB family looped-hinge helix DNA binding protein
MLVKLSSKGQLVIPKSLRRALGLEAGTRFRVRLDKSCIILEPVTASPIAALFGRYADVDLLSDLEAEHQQEVRDEGPVRA